MPAERIFDVDFAPVDFSVSRPAGVDLPNSHSINADDVIGSFNGGFIQYERINLSQLTEEGRLFQPVSINVQRTWNAPEGFDANFAPSTSAMEWIYIFQSPLPNERIRNDPELWINALRDFGLDRSDAYGSLIPESIKDSNQTLYAQRTRYINNMANTQSAWNQTSVPGDAFYPLLAQTMSVAEFDSWGSMNPVAGAALYCYRIVLHYTQNVSGNDPTNPLVAAQGTTIRKFSPVTVQIQCIEPKISESEYLINAANIYNGWNNDNANRI